MPSLLDTKTTVVSLPRYVASDAAAPQASLLPATSAARDTLDEATLLTPRSDVFPLRAALAVPRSLVGTHAAASLLPPGPVSAVVPQRVDAWPLAAHLQQTQDALRAQLGIDVDTWQTPLAAATPQLLMDVFEALDDAFFLQEAAPGAVQRDPLTYAVRTFATAYAAGAPYQALASYVALPLTVPQPYLVTANPQRFADFADYLALLWQANVNVVVALHYVASWPKQGSRNVGPFVVTAQPACVWMAPAESVAPGCVPASFATTAYDVAYAGEVRTLQLVRVRWPDFGVLPPGHLAALRACTQAHDAAPRLAVHCAAGIGRSGTFVLAHAMHQRPEAAVGDAVLTLAQLRLQRRGAVETAEQFAAALQ